MNSDVPDEFSGFLHNLLKAPDVVPDISSLQGMIRIRNHVTGNAALLAEFGNDAGFNPRISVASEGYGLSEGKGKGILKRGIKNKMHPFRC